MNIDVRVGECAEVDQFLDQQLSRDARSKGFTWSPVGFSVTIGDERQTVGALTGHINWEWMYIEKMAVAAGHRQLGWGTQLLDRADQVAADRSCRGIWVDTFSFQSPEFYLKHGFVEVGRIKDFPPGHDRVFFQKRLLD